MACCKEKAVAVQGISPKRSCTDIIFLILLACSWAWVIVLIMHAKDDGANIDRIIYPVDMGREICGKSASQVSKPFGAFPHLLNIDHVVCVASCAETNNPTSTQMALNYKSVEFMNWCLPDPSDNAISNVLSDFNSSWDGPARYISRHVTDLYKLRWVILATAGASIFLSLIVVLLTRSCVGFLVYGSIFLMLGGGVVLGGGFFYFYNDAKNAVSSVSTDSWLVLAIVTWAVTFILFCLVIFLRKEIRIAKTVVAEASRVIGDMKCLMFYPFLPALGILAVFVAFVIITLYLYSTGDYNAVATPQAILQYASSHPNAGTATSNPALSYVWSWAEAYQYWSIYNLFNMFWSTQFVYYLGYLTISGAVANWYFAVTELDGTKRRGDEEDSLPNYAIARSCCRSTIYHMGTAAFAALVIAIIRTARAILAYIREKTKGSENKCARAVLCICACCLSCLEACLDKVSKNALVWTSIFGDNFCVSVCSSFALILKHLVKVAAVNTVSSFIVFICKLCIALASTAGCAAFIQYYKSLKDEIYSNVIPLIAVFIITYFLAAMMLGVFESTIDSIFFCFLVDVEFNLESGQPMRASKELSEIINAYQEESQQQAAIRAPMKSKIVPHDTDEGSAEE